MGALLRHAVHFYNYLMDSWKPSNFPTARFVSEFGFQSFPSLRTWKQATDQDEDLVFPLSKLANHRQHHTVGENSSPEHCVRAAKTLLNSFRAPCLSLSLRPSGLNFQLLLTEFAALIIPGNANLERKVYSKFNGPRVNMTAQEQFRIFCYLTQINQAVSIKTAVEKFRRDRSAINPTSGEGNNMGALYWQLNDIWQAPTWASLGKDSQR